MNSRARKKTPVLSKLSQLYFTTAIYNTSTLILNTPKVALIFGKLENALLQNYYLMSSKISYLLKT